MGNIRTYTGTLKRRKRAEFVLSTVTNMIKGRSPLSCISNEIGVVLFFSCTSKFRSRYFSLHENLPSWEYKKSWLKLK